MKAFDSENLGGRDRTPRATLKPSAVLDSLLAARGGSISTEEFMRAALYHPEAGYYALNVRNIGRRGDFSTAATLSPALGHAIARWAMKRRRALKPRWHWNLIEAGAGTGQLARAVLEGLSPLDRARVVYHIVEVSPALRRLQEEALAGRRARWHNSVNDALSDASGEALIFSNELVDAFPCLQVVRTGKQWSKVMVARSNEGFEERFVPLDDKRLSDWPASAIARGDRFAEGQRCELHLDYAEWLRSFSREFKRGWLLTIDYGESIESLYHRHPGGTLRGYSFHSMAQGLEIYERFGQQDLTADVNFTDLITWGEICGLRATRFETQRDFIIRNLPDAERRARRDAALAFVLNPQGMGEAFKVLEQAKIRGESG
ncbi:MAG TPA: SAM-dependent methyltransferase [Blastocatellia bacterium]|jgi:SAM-dependent MidA family methyltransferase